MSEGTSLKHKDILIGPSQVALDITNKCNLRCLHCYNESGENIQSENELTDDEVMALIDDLCKIKIFNLCFCGGEPLLRKDLIIRAVKKLKENNIPNVAIVTNGLLLTKDIAKEFKDVGLTRVQISLDGASCASHDRLRNKRGAFDSAIKAIEILKEVGIDANIAFTPTAFNIKEIKGLHTLLRSYQLYDIDFRTQPLMLMGRASSNIKDINPSEMQYRQFIKEINEINDSHMKPYIKWGDPVDHLIRFRSRKLCVNQCMIRANGDIVCSSYLPLVVGNIKKHSLLDYWNSGLAGIWEYEIPLKMAETIKSIEDMNNSNNNFPILWKENDLFIDLIENDLNDLRLIGLK